MSLVHNSHSLAEKWPPFAHKKSSKNSSSNNELREHSFPHGYSSPSLVSVPERIGLASGTGVPEHGEESRFFGSTAPEGDQPLAVCPTVISSALVPGRLKILSLRQLIPCHVFAFAMSGSIRN